MVRFMGFRHTVKKEDCEVWIPLLKRAYRDIVCTVTFSFPNDISLDKTIEETINITVQIQANRLQEEVDKKFELYGGFTHFELVIPPIWSQTVVWQFMPTIDEWIKTSNNSDEDTNIPQSTKDIDICSKAIEQLSDLLSYLPGRENGCFGNWYCPLKYVKYVCTQVHLQAQTHQKTHLPEELLDESSTKHGIARIFFEQSVDTPITHDTDDILTTTPINENRMSRCNRIKSTLLAQLSKMFGRSNANTTTVTTTYADERKDEYIDEDEDTDTDYTLIIQSDTGYTWRLSSCGYTNYLTLDFDLDDGFIEGGLPKCHEQFEEWKQGGCHGEIFKLLHPIIKHD